ncbi:hypothetical protein [Paenibacillus rigui]|uniref:Flagellar hook-length control protein-like C-terminal domain-containing protein n=1 Tax=Paenibacillus rigui TaxID=554312 RepID=A0A229UML3_9BACL|nr:hypothetical protein [Paenibacillus rigui]OXM84650.1 hypothetical protein CF651_19285 [Paenibacillus rigui]
MNISGLIRSFVGDSQAAEPKKLELKTGEVVKGVVQQILPNDEAMLNINGVQVRAKLETPLKQGDVTLFQVQPETSGGQIVLKPLDASAVQIADSSFSELLKNVGLPDTAANRQLVQALHQAGIPMLKENVQAFVQLQSQMPASFKQEDWLPSAIVAFQKGVPLTPDSINAVKQVLTGPAFHETLQQLEAQIKNVLTAPDSTLSSTSKVALNTFLQVLDSMKEASGQVIQQRPEGTVKPAAAFEGSEVPTVKPAVTEASGGQAGRAAGTTELAAGKLLAGSPVAAGTVVQGPVLDSAAMKSQAGAPVINSGDGDLASAPNPSANREQAAPQTTVGSGAMVNGHQQSAAPAAPRTGNGLAGAVQAPNTANYVPDTNGETVPESVQRTVSSGPLTTASQGTAVPAGASFSAMHENHGSEALRSMPKNANDGMAASSFIHSDGEQAEGERSVSPSLLRTAGNNDESLKQTQMNPAPNENWISKLVKSLGVAHENQLFKLPELATDKGQLLDRDSDPRAAQLSAQGITTQEPNKVADTLKSALLQLMQADDMPSSFKDTAQQVVQHITGQQLLLNSDKSSMFSHITLFVPLMNANGEQTAAIHIQSRKGKRGELDAQNCRLVFDLQMKTLGDTMIDVQVVDRIVSLQVHNDQPYIGQLLEEHRDDIAASLSGIGYQFISLKCSPYPEKGQDSSPSTDPGKMDVSAMAASLQSMYGNKPYRGMDVRV